MTPLAVFHDNGKFKVSWFNPTNLRYEPVLEFNSYKDFADYTELCARHSPGHGSYPP